MSDLRKSFEAQFGSACARAVMNAAEGHERLEQAVGHCLQQDRGTDEFRWALLVCIGYDCVKRFPEEHNITCSWEDFQSWAKGWSGYLGQFEGIPDALAMLAGMYDWLLGGEEQEQEQEQEPNGTSN